MLSSITSNFFFQQLLDAGALSLTQERDDLETLPTNIVLNYNTVPEGQFSDFFYFF